MPADICRPEVLDIEPYRPGKPLSLADRESGALACLMSNENVLGAPALAVRAAAEGVASAYQYPDGPATHLKSALAERLNVSPQQITLGNGSNDALDLVARCFLAPEREAVYSRHAFAVYDLVTRLSGARARITSANAFDDAMPFGDNLSAHLEAINDATRVVFIANPNNPTGTWIDGESLLKFLRAVPPSVIVVLDQAYSEYVEAPDYVNAIEWLDEFPNLVVTQTFSKIYALAGLRVGYAVSSREIAEWLNRIRQPFNVNSVGQAAALAALSDDAHVEKSRAMNRAGLEQLEKGCVELNLQSLPSVANFACIRVGARMREICDALFERGIIVRPIENYGLPDYLRVTVGREEDNARFINALRDMRETLLQDAVQ